MQVPEPRERSPLVWLKLRQAGIASFGFGQKATTDDFACP